MLSAALLELGTPGLPCHKQTKKGKAANVTDWNDCRQSHLLMKKLAHRSLLLKQYRGA